MVSTLCFICVTLKIFSRSSRKLFLELTGSSDFVRFAKGKFYSHLACSCPMILLVWTHMAIFGSLQPYCLQGCGGFLRIVWIHNGQYLRTTRSFQVFLACFRTCMYRAMREDLTCNQLCHIHRTLTFYSYKIFVHT